MNDYGVTVKPITSRNLEAKAILDVLPTFKVQNMVLDDKIHGTVFWPPPC